MATQKPKADAPQAEMPKPNPGEVCPCCGRKVPVNAKPVLTDEERKQRDAQRRTEYNSRPDVKERRKAYNAKRNAELKELRDLQKQLVYEAENGK